MQVSDWWRNNEGLFKRAYENLEARVAVEFDARIRFDFLLGAGATDARTCNSLRRLLSSANCCTGGNSRVTALEDRAVADCDSQQDHFHNL